MTEIRVYQRDDMEYDAEVVLTDGMKMNNHGPLLDMVAWSEEMVEAGKADIPEGKAE